MCVHTLTIQKCFNYALRRPYIEQFVSERYFQIVIWICIPIDLKASRRTAHSVKCETLNHAHFSAWKWHFTILQMFISIIIEFLGFWNMDEHHKPPERTNRFGQLHWWLFTRFVGESVILIETDERFKFLRTINFHRIINASAHYRSRSLRVFNVSEKTTKTQLKFSNKTNH